MLTPHCPLKIICLMLRHSAIIILYIPHFLEKTLFQNSIPYYIPCDIPMRLLWYVWLQACDLLDGLYCTYEPN